MPNAYSQIMRGTTPSITMTYRTVDVSTIVEAWLTIKQDVPQTVINKDLSAAEVGASTLTWYLTQEDTLRIKNGRNVQIQCRYLLQDGTAGGSAIYDVSPYDILRDGVIS